MQLSFDLFITRLDTGDDHHPVCLTLGSGAGNVRLMPCFIEDPTPCRAMGIEFPLSTDLIGKTMRCTVEFIKESAAASGRSGHIRLVANKDIDITKFVSGVATVIPEPVESYFVEISTDDDDVFPRFTAQFNLSADEYSVLRKMKLKCAKVRFQVVK